MKTVYIQYFLIGLVALLLLFAAFRYFRLTEGFQDTGGATAGITDALQCSALKAYLENLIGQYDTLIQSGKYEKDTGGYKAGDPIVFTAEQRLGYEKGLVKTKRLIQANRKAWEDLRCTGTLRKAFPGEVGLLPETFTEPEFTNYCSIMKENTETMLQQLKVMQCTQRNLRVLGTSEALSDTDRANGAKTVSETLRELQALLHANIQKTKGLRKEGEAGEVNCSGIPSVIKLYMDLNPDNPQSLIDNIPMCETLTDSELNRVELCCYEDGKVNNPTLPPLPLDSCEKMQKDLAVEGEQLKVLQCNYLTGGAFLEEENKKKMEEAYSKYKDTRAKVAEKGCTGVPAEIANVTTKDPMPQLSHSCPYTMDAAVQAIIKEREAAPTTFIPKSG